MDDLVPPAERLVETTIKGLFNKERLVKIIEDFICFIDNNARDKVICRYPQFFAATKLLKNIEKNLRPKGKGKGGVYHGATGCGKSYIMLFLSRLLMRSKTFKRPLILLITDRSELNDQLTQLFEKYSNYLQVAKKTNIKKVGSREELKDLFKKFSSGAIFLTNIQKFSENNELLSDKSNIICISDEAHRSQHNLGAEYREEEEKIVFTVPFARRVHDSLPNATYVGFTATPKDETMDVFGEIVDQYSMEDSKNDNFTVELITEERRVPLELDEVKAKLLDSLEEAQQNESKLLQMRRIIELPGRITKVV
ncbi:type I restriction endonuclease, partial [Microbacterium esteraromaticum]